MTRPKRLLLFAILVGAAGAAIAIRARMAASAHTSSIVDLVAVGGESEAEAINNRDEVVGQSTNKFGAPCAFLWRKGRMTDLPELTSPPGAGGDAHAYAINDAGAIVGDCDIGGGDPSNGRGTYDAVIWENGSIRDIGALAGFQCGRAQSINNAGRVVCQGIDESHGPRSDEYRSQLGIYQSGHGPEMIDARLYAVNNRGDSVSVNDANGRYRIRITSSSGLHALAGLKLGESPLNVFINDRRQVFVTIGRAIVNNGGVNSGTGSYVVAWLNGKTKVVLPLPPGETDALARGVNNIGQIVGEAYRRNEYPPHDHGVLWTGAKVVDLTKAYAQGTDWIVESAAAINDNGVIVGRGRRGSQQRHAVMIRTASARP